MTPLSESVNSRSTSTMWRRTRRRGLALPLRLFLEELEPRCVLSGGVVASLTPGLTPEQSAGQSINAFGQDLYSLLQSQAGGSGNMFFSPTSIATALAMVDAGAGGETASQIGSVLHAANLDPNVLAQEFGSLLTSLNSAGQGQYAVAVADALWGQQDFPFNQAFLNLLQANYGAGLKQVDFKGDTEGARQTINDWVAQQTANKIQDLFPSGTITPAERLVLTNAIYFKGAWANPFNTIDTSNANFTLSSGDQVSTPTMHQTTQFGYMDSDGYQVLEMPYADGRMAMDIMLPSADSGLQGLDVSQLPSDLSGWLGGLSAYDVQVSLPKFGMTDQFDLSDQLKALGMTDAFTKQADFSGISPLPLKISDVVHKAFVGVSEDGTEAAAATGIGVCRVACVTYQPPLPQAVFNADHPFLFVIRDTQSGSVLFEGQVADPTSAAADPSAPAIPVIPSKPAPDPITVPVLPPTVPPTVTAPPTVVPPVTAPPTVVPPVTAPPVANPPVGSSPITLAPPVTAYPTVVPVIAASASDPSQAQRIVAAPSHPAPIDLSGSTADILLAEASGRASLDVSVAVPSDLSAGASATLSSQKVAPVFTLNQPALTAEMQGPALVTDTLQVLLDPRDEKKAPFTILFGTGFGPPKL